MAEPSFWYTCPACGIAEKYPGHLDGNRVKCDSCKEIITPQTAADPSAFLSATADVPALKPTRRVVSPGVADFLKTMPVIRGVGGLWSDGRCKPPTYRYDDSPTFVLQKCSDLASYIAQSFALELLHLQDDRTRVGLAKGTSQTAGSPHFRIIHLDDSSTYIIIDIRFSSAYNTLKIQISHFIHLKYDPIGRHLNRHTDYNLIERIWIKLFLLLIFPIGIIWLRFFEPTLRSRDQVCPETEQNSLALRQRIIQCYHTALLNNGIADATSGSTR